MMFFTDEIFMMGKIFQIKWRNELKIFSKLKLRILKIAGRGDLGLESDVSMLGGSLLLTYADKRGEGGQKSENLAAIICERSLK